MSTTVESNVETGMVIEVQAATMDPSKPKEDLKREHPDNPTLVGPETKRQCVTEPVVQSTESSQATMTEEEKKLDEENKKLVTYYRRVPYEGVTRVWVYVKRLGKIVNFQITNVPYLIERFVGFYLSGDAQGDLSKLETSLERCLAAVRQAKLDIEMSH